MIGGYTLGTKTFDALIFGYYEGKLIYAACTRNGFTPASRALLSKKFKGLETTECPFANLPEPKGGRWGAGLAKAKMAACRWLKPVLAGQFEFLDGREPSPSLALRRAARGQEGQERRARRLTSGITAAGFAAVRSDPRPAVLLCTVGVACA